MTNRRLLQHEKKAQALANCRLQKTLVLDLDDFPGDVRYTRSEQLRLLVRDYVVYLEKLGKLVATPLDQFE